MEKLSPTTDGVSLDLTAQNLERLEQLFPEAFCEGKVDFDVLREILGDSVDERTERYGLSWNGKSEARRIAQMPSAGTLRPVPEESVDWETTQNLFIEGDNLEVLKLLQKSFHRRVKMIYIDPPYNTGKEFIYPDRFQDNLDTYLRYTGQKDEGGLKLSANTETAGRYHTNWLSMMYPRLKLARNLLRDDGLIFVSIDDHEVHNLRHLMDEVFGTECFIVSLIWKKRDGAPNDRTVGSTHDYIVVYGKSLNAAGSRTVAEESLNLMPRTEKANSQYRVFPEPDGPDSRGPFRKIDTTANAKGGRDVASLHFGIVNPHSGITVLPRKGTCWRHSEEEMRRLQADNRLYWGVDGTASTPMRKLFLGEARAGMATPSILPDIALNQHASRELEMLFGEKGVFDTPKPVGLMSFLVGIGSNPGDIVLDFFAGSGSMGDAIFRENSKSENNRRFILVQLPEPIEDNEFSSVSAITLRRLTAASESASAETREQLPGVGRSRAPDFGFRAFRLDSSNIKPWDPAYDNVEGAL